MPTPPASRAPITPAEAGAFLGVSSQAKFLKDAHDGACGLFATVLGPRTNALHENHFHLDLGRGGRYKICH